jgi:hypothetical protein
MEEFFGFRNFRQFERRAVDRTDAVLTARAGDHRLDRRDSIALPHWRSQSRRGSRLPISLEGTHAGRRHEAFGSDDAALTRSVATGTTRAPAHRVC